MYTMNAARMQLAATEHRLYETNHDPKIRWEAQLSLLVLQSDIL